MGTGEWPLVGRDDELALLADKLREKHRSVAIAGEAGVGKTRLQRELIAALEAAGLPVRRAIATGTTSSIPFGALAHLLPLQEEENVDRYALLLRATRVLADPESDRQVIAVDDAHVLDELSCAVIHQLVSHDQATVVLTVRSGEIVHDAISSLWKDGYMERVELQPLSRGETETLLRSMVGGTIALRTIAHFWESSRGNPLFLREMVLGALDSGALSDRTGIWVWDETQPSVRLGELVQRRLEGVGANEQRGLELLAIGEPLSARMFEGLTPGVLAELERKGLVVERADERRSVVRLVHPAYAEALRAQMPTRVAKALRSELVDAFVATGNRRREDPLRVALWHLESDDEPIVDLLFAGYQTSIDATDFELALRFVRRLLDAEPTLGHAWRCIYALQSMRRNDEALTFVQRYADAEGPDEDRAQFAVVGSFALRDLGRTDDALALLERTAETLPSDWAIALRGYAAEQLWQAGRYGPALELSLPALDTASSEYSARPLMLSTAICVQATIGRTRDALDLADRYMPDISTTGVRDLTRLFSAQLRALALDGRIDEAIAIARDVHQWASDTGDELARQGSAAALAAFYLGRGTARTALEYARECNAILRVVQPVESYFGGYEAEALALLGEADAAADAFEQQPPYRGAQHPDSTRQLAWVAAARGDLSEARRLAMASADASGAAGGLSTELMALYDAVRLGATEHAGRLAALCERCQGAHAAAVGRHASGLRDDDAVVLAQASEELEAIGRILCAAEASAQASVAYARNGLKARASWSAGRFRSLADRCEGATTPVVAAGPVADPLTRREREVVTLAVQGLTNREIAERLVASVRTVEGHLQKAYAKLGITGRGELAGAAEEDR